MIDEKEEIKSLYSSNTYEDSHGTESTDITSMLDSKMYDVGESLKESYDRKKSHESNKIFSIENIEYLE